MPQIVKTLQALAAGAWLVLSAGAPLLADEPATLHADLGDLGSPGGTPLKWVPWAQRDEVRPRFSVDTAHHRSGPASLAISGAGNAAEYGGWARTVPGVVGGRTYRLSAFFRWESVPDPSRDIVARIDWLDDAGKRVGQPDYAYQTRPDGDWVQVFLTVPSPAGATRAKVELSLGWAPFGTVWWADASLDEVAPVQPRLVRVGTISLHPRNDPDNLGAYLRAIDAISAEKPDIVCLGEEILVEGNSRAYSEAAEPIPGPSTERIGERARRYKMYVVAGLTERDGPLCYNTAVLIDRHGNVAGKYRKVYLPREEIEGGLTPGSFCPVFDTDFGRIGMMICWDGEYVDPARAMAVQGAEIIFVPAAGGYMTLLKARALENHLYVVSSGYDLDSAIIDPTGEVLFSTRESGVNHTMTVDLNARFLDPWIGDMRPRFHKEIRHDSLLPSQDHP